MTKTHGKSKTREYRIWGLMIDRCENSQMWAYAKYGGRGISIHPAWRADFMAFLRDMGPKPSPLHTIDRINVDGNYEPGNCRWATAANPCRWLTRCGSPEISWITLPPFSDLQSSDGPLSER